MIPHYIGIVGHAEDKFTPETKGGIDIWAEEVATRLGRQTIIYPPKNLYWQTEYRPRNIKIANRSDIDEV